ncbi:MAG: OsmC family peroxiredoxin [Chitinophagaceae bacterium]|nr:MAG: OsmC family peroxiredoxin [Chitinophagaceae bacterium]
MDTHIINSAHQGGMSFSTTIDTHQLITDTTADNGGNNEGPSPKRLMLASLAGCTGIDVVSVLEKMKVPFSQLSIKVSALVSDNHPKVYTQVSVNYQIKVAAEHQPKVEKAVQLSSEKYCGVMAMFRGFAKVETVVEFL